MQPHTPAGRCSTQEKDGQPRRADAAEVLLPRAAGDDRDGRAAGGGGRRSTPGRAGEDGHRPNRRREAGERRPDWRREEDGLRPDLRREAEELRPDRRREAEERRADRRREAG